MENSKNLINRMWDAHSEPRWRIEPSLDGFVQFRPFFLPRPGMIVEVPDHLKTFQNMLVTLPSKEQATGLLNNIHRIRDLPDDLRLAMNDLVMASRRVALTYDKFATAHEKQLLSETGDKASTKIIVEKKQRPLIYRKKRSNPSATSTQAIIGKPEEVLVTIKTENNGPAAKRPRKDLVLLPTADVLVNQVATEPLLIQWPVALQDGDDSVVEDSWVILDQDLPAFE